MSFSFFHVGLADQVGAFAAVLRPLHLLIEARVLAAERLHGDDTTVPVLAKTKTDIGRLWTYVRDDRPFAGPAPPAALFRYSRDRRAEHSVAHLTGYGGILQADAYAAYNALFRSDRSPAPLTRALYWAHARRKFFELADVAAQLKRRKDASVISPIAKLNDVDPQAWLADVLAHRRHTTTSACRAVAVELASARRTAQGSIETALTEGLLEPNAPAVCRQGRRGILALGDMTQRR